jgi:hydroxypyruvate isomerase
MKRRTFVKEGMLAAAALSLPSFTSKANQVVLDNGFKMKFSPEFGIFADLAGSNPVDQIKWGYDQGFRAWENTFLKNRPVEEQEKISKTVQGLGMEFGQFVGTLTFKDVTFAGRDSGGHGERQP